MRPRAPGPHERGAVRALQHGGCECPCPHRTRTYCWAGGGGRRRVVQPGFDRGMAALLAPPPHAKTHCRLMPPPPWAFSACLRRRPCPLTCRRFERRPSASRAGHFTSRVCALPCWLAGPPTKCPSSSLLMGCPPCLEGCSVSCWPLGTSNPYAYNRCCPGCCRHAAAPAATMLPDDTVPYVPVCCGLSACCLLLLLLCLLRRPLPGRGRGGAAGHAVQPARPHSSAR